MTNPDQKSPHPPGSRIRRRTWLAVAVSGTLAVGLTAGILIGNSGSPKVAAASVTTTPTTAPSDSPDGPWDHPAGAPRDGGPGGTVTSVTSSAVSITTPDGSTIAIPTDSTTVFERLTQTSASAIKTAAVALAFGSQQHPATLRAAVIVFWNPTAASAAPDDDTTADWGPREGVNGVKGTVRGATSSSLELTASDGTTTTVDYGPDTTILSAAPVARHSVTPGEHAYILDQATSRGVAQRVVVADQKLSFLEIP